MMIPNIGPPYTRHVQFIVVALDEYQPFALAISGAERSGAKLMHLLEIASSRAGQHQDRYHKCYESTGRNTNGVAKFA